MNKYSQAAMQLAVRVGKFLRRKSPEIMTGIGVVGIGATIYTTVKAVPKIQEIKEEAKATLDDIDAAEANNLPNYSAEDAAKDRKIVRVQTAVKLVKAVAPVVASVGVTLSGFLGAHKILSERNATLSALTMATDKAFREYRKKVAETFGEEAEHDLRYGLTEEEVEVKAIGEDGKENVVKERRKVQNRAGYFGQFDFIFDENVPGWERDARANKTYVLQIQDWANKEAERKFYLYHNGLSVADICERFAIKNPKEHEDPEMMELAGELQQRLMQCTIDFFRERDVKDIWSVAWDADNLPSSIEEGVWIPYSDSSITLEKITEDGRVPVAFVI